MTTSEQLTEIERLTELQASQGLEELQRNSENIEQIYKYKRSQGFGVAVVFLLNELEGFKRREGYALAVYDRLEETKADESDQLWNRNMWRITARNNKALAELCRILLIALIPSQAD